ncbi:MAG: alpha-hydroxy-acid oxidizing protein [Holophaga sp.]|nr:alpha-hydroxy-acid oxidizing protein [Holophaga sp.]
MFRRSFLKNSAFFGVGMLASDALLPAATPAAQPSKPVPPPATAPTPAHTASSIAAAYPPEYGPASAKGKVSEVYQKARQVMYPICRVCPQCDGVACAGEFPGMGGLWSGASFRNNFTDLQAVRLKLRPLNDVSNQDKKPDTSTVLFGQKLSLPAVAAPIGGVGFNFRRILPDAEYFDRIIGGCVEAGTLGAIGDGQTDPMAEVKARYQVIKHYQGRAIAGIKPRPQANLLQLVRFAEEAGACMITIDIDSGGRYQGNPRDLMVEPKSMAQLREIVRATKIPVVVKGIMTPEDAIWAGEAGAAGICVSNHGGRVLDHTPGTATVLPEIAKAVKGKLVILVDGCVHYGDDVMKYVALGADAVMVGRHIIRAAFGGGRPGVALFMQTMRDELEAAMVVTGVPDVRSINRKILA